MAYTHSFNTSATTPTQTSSQSQSLPFQAPLPPPQTFDILPQLHEILARLDHTAADPINAVPGEADSTAYPELQPLEPKDLPGEVNPVQSKIRRAMRELEKLPDMDRTVGEQDEEIKALVEKEVKQREVLRRLGDVAKGLGESMGQGK